MLKSYLQVVRLVYIILWKSLGMFKFTKSETDLGKLAWPTQYKVICDWLRNTQDIVKRLEKRQVVISLDIAKLYDLLQSSSPEGEHDVQ